jgi:hypothetical protein
MKELRQREMKKPVGRFRYRRKDKIKLHLKETEKNCMNFMYLSQDRQNSDGLL